MRRRRRDPGLIGNPILIGALTVLVTIVAVTLAYQANNGLPFVPRYTLYAQVADASELTKGAEVHMGGALVGMVDNITPARGPQGQPIALLDLKLNKSVEPLPVDSTFVIRLKGAIGLKYLDVTPGVSKKTFKDGATVPLDQTGAEVDLDQVLGMFTAPTRSAVQQETNGFSDALAGRGQDINDAIGAFLPLVTDLGPVAKNLSSKTTDLGGFFRGLESFAGALAPVAQDQADLYVNLDTTFRALAGVAVPYLQNWISQTPPTFQSVISNSPSLQSFLTDTAGLFSELRPGFATFPSTAPVLADAFAAGARNLPATAGLDQRLVALADTLRNYGQNSDVTGGLDRLKLTLNSLRSPLAYLTPVQSSCNYVTLFLRNIASTLSEPIISGTALRFDLVTIGDVLGGEAVPSQKPYTTPNLTGAGEYGPLHSDPYPNTDSPGEVPECSAGNEPYSATSARIGNPPGNVGLKTEKTTRPKS